MGVLSDSLHYEKSRGNFTQGQKHLNYLLSFKIFPPVDTHWQGAAGSMKPKREIHNRLSKILHVRCNYFFFLLVHAILFPKPVSLMKQRNLLANVDNVEMKNNQHKTVQGTPLRMWLAHWLCVMEGPKGPVKHAGGGLSKLETLTVLLKDRRSIEKYSVRLIHIYFSANKSLMYFIAFLVRLSKSQKVRYV